MNEGQINVEQAEGESESDFLKRLADVTLIEEDLTRAGLYNTNEFKKNLKTIIKSEWKIENLVKSFNNDNQFLLNKTFAGFKKYFNEVYGIGNQNLEVEDYIALINAYLDSEAPRLIKGKTKLKTKGEKEEETNEESNEETKAVDLSEETLDDIYGDTPAPEVAVATSIIDLPEVEAKIIPPKLLRSELKLKGVKISKEEDILRFENTANNQSIYLKLSNPPRGPGSANVNKIISVSFDNVEYENLSKKTLGGMFLTRLKIIGLNDNDIDVITEMIAPSREKLNKITPTEFIKFFDRIENGDVIKGEGLKKPKKTKKKPTVQKGASLKKDIPTHCQFGKLILLLNKLYYKNVLSVKDSNNVNVQGIPNTKVSENLVNILMKICSDGEINKNDVDNLEQKEIILYNILLTKAGLSKDHNIDIKKTIKALKDRLTLVEGEIVAGNDNEELKKELYDVVFKLANVGAISISSARKYYKDTLKLYFKK
jgi:hypothetical protein